MKLASDKELIEFLDAITSLDEYNQQHVEKLIHLKLAWEDYKKKPNLFSGFFPQSYKDLVRDIERAFERKLG